MSEIAPLSTTSVSRVDTTAPSYARTTDESAASNQVRRGEDLVEFSQVATYLSKLRQLPIREDLVSRVKDEIARGVYDTPEKLDAAMNEMLGDF